ncbi:MAG: Rieske (2Fe-2S) protein [Planctomycetes bacterium]|nr:Rieske (2Fe-2S) protein [Planctomycetota bacterium]
MGWILSIGDVDNLPTRRGFLDWLIGLGSLITGAAMTVPALMYLWPAARGGTKEKVEVAGAADMNVGQSKTMHVGGQAVIVVRDRSGFKAFSAACTHLGCLVQWDSARKEFLCPCHAAVFDANGGVVAGPPPSPLLAYKVDEVDGKVYVSAS